MTSATIRSVLQAAKNKLSSAHTAAQKDLGNAEDALRRHLDIQKLSNDDILAVVNQRRQLLGVGEIEEFTADTVLDAGVLGRGSQAAFNKESALRDIAGLIEAEAGFGKLAKTDVAAILKDIAALESDPALLQAVTRRGFVERGLSLVDGPFCPLCDTKWDDVRHLKKHLQTKLTKSKAGEALQQRLLKHGAEVANQARTLVAAPRAASASREVGRAGGPCVRSDGVVRTPERRWRRRWTRLKT